MAPHISRRRFLGQGLAGFSLAATAPAFLNFSSRVFADAEATNDRILVVLQLSGGNDGLSMLPPVDDDAYHRARRTTGIARRDALPLVEGLGLHPELKGVQRLYGDGRLAVVQGVSYPNPNRSHFKSMDIWHTADARGRGRKTGWLGRAIDARCPDSKEPNLVVNVGRELPYALEAEVHKAVSFDDPASYRWTGNPKDRMDFEKLNEPVPAEQQLQWLHRVAVDARASSQEIRTAAAGYRARAAYPQSPLSADLRTVASLIAGGLETRVYYVSFGSFDTHSRQRNQYANLMRQLDGALAAFFADLKAQGLSKRVLLVSFSEFGRRVAENGSLGTDHGVAGPMLLAGDAVKGGVYADHPSLTDLDRGDLKMQVDFRSVYATALEKWMGVDAARVLGRAYPKLPLL